MTEKRFDIVVQDKVARTIKQELTNIGNAARGTRGFVAQLKAEMAGLASAQGGARGAATEAGRAMREEAAAANASRNALAAQRREIEATTKALRDQAAAARAAASARGAGAGSGGGQPYGPPAPGPRQPSGGGGAGRTTAGVSPAAVAGYAAAAKNIKDVGAQSKLSAQYAAQLGFQLNDVGVSLASGQKPLTVFIQQGAQIAQIPAQAGLSWKQFGGQVAGTLGIVQRTGSAALDAAAAQASTAAKAVAAANAEAAANVRVAETEVALAAAQARVATTSTEQAAAAARVTAANEALAASNGQAAVTAEALATAQAEAGVASKAASSAATTSLSGLARAGIIGAAAAAAAAVGIGLLNREASNDSGLQKYNKSMGFTAKEVKKLNDVQVTFVDTAKALWQEAGNDVKKYFADEFGVSMKDVKSYMKDAMDYVTEKGRQGLASIYALVAGTKAYLGALEKGGALGFAKTLIGQGDPNLLKNTYGKAFTDADKYLQDLGSRSIKTARGIARKRQDELADELRSPGRKNKGAKGWDRAQELKNANGELDAQIALMDKYGDELERANQLEQIAKKFRDHNVPLTAAETDGLNKKIMALQEGRRVQEAMTAADEAANGASRKYEAQLSALDKMLSAGKLTQEQYNEQMRLAMRAYEDATDPLAALNRELQRNGELMGLYGRSRDVKSYIQQLEQAAEAQGKSIYQPGKVANDNGEIVVTGRSKRLNGDAQGMVDEYKRQQQQDEYSRFFEANDSSQNYQNPNDSSYVLDHAKELYAELDRLRQGDVISEQEAANRKKDLDRAYLDARLDNTSRVLDNLATLQSSNNKKVAALGKAAAIAQATIDGIRAVQAALAGPPGPPWSFAIAAATGAATAANVAKIAGVGFMSGGYTGAGGNSEVAGPVHRNEYVFDAAATKRIGVPALEAMRRGQLAQPSNDNGRGGTNVTIRPMPGVYVEERATSSGEIELIARRVAREEAPRAVAADLKRGASTQTGRAMRSSYGLGRTDR